MPHGGGAFVIRISGSAAMPGILSQLRSPKAFASAATELRALRIRARTRYRPPAVDTQSEGASIAPPKNESIRAGADCEERIYKAMAFHID